MGVEFFYVDGWAVEYRDMIKLISAFPTILQIQLERVTVQ